MNRQLGNEAIQLHATIEEFAADGYTHVECFCPRCRMTFEVDRLVTGTQPAPDLDSIPTLHS